MKIFRIILLLFFTQSNAAFYLIEHKGNKMHVKATFAASEFENNKVGEFFIPGVIWGSNYGKQIQNLKTNVSFDPKTKTVVPDKDKVLEINYDIISAQEVHKFADTYEHFITKDNFYMLGLGLFVHPENFKGDVTIQIKSKVRHIGYNKAPYFPLDNTFLTNINKLNDLVFIGSDDLKYFTRGNSDVILWCDDLSIKNAFENLVLPAFKKHEEFWSSSPRRHLSIIFISPFQYDKFIKRGGTVIDSTILFFLTPNVSYGDLSFVSKHEHLHFWFGKLLYGPKWFNEGFTDYYVDKIDFYYDKNVEHFIGRYNTRLHEYFTSPARVLSDEEIEKYFFQVKTAQRLPYAKGYLIAGQLDQIIDLDRALKKMMSLCAKDPKYCKFSAQNLINCAGKISPQKQKAIKNIIADFNSTSPSKRLVKGVKLTYKKIYVNKFALDMFKIMENKSIAGKDLNAIEDKYNPETNYKVQGINFNYESGKGSIIIEEDKKKKDIKIPSTKGEIVIPYYLLEANIQPN